MSFFARFRRGAPSAPPPSELIGRWRLAAADPALGLDPGAEMVFEPGGGLTYWIPGEDRDSVLLLTYRVDGDILITDQPSNPRRDCTGFRVDGDTLTLDYGGGIARFERLRS